MNIIKDDNFKQITKFINDLDNVQDFQINGNNIFHLLIVHNSKHVFELFKLYTNLFKYGDNNANETPIHLLAKYGMYPMLKQCLEYDDSFVNLVNENNENLLFYCVDNFDMFKWILNNTNCDTLCLNNNNETILTILINLNQIEFVQTLLPYYNNINFPTLSSPLTIATINNNEKMVSILLKNKANPNIIDKYGKSALIYSVLNKNINNVKQLLKIKNLNINYSGIDGTYNPLVIALSKKDFNICDLLLKHKIKLNSQNRFMETPVHIAIKLFNAIDNPNLINKIIKQDGMFSANMHIKNLNGITPCDLITKYNQDNCKNHNKNIINYNCKQCANKSNNTKDKSNNTKDKSNNTKDKSNNKQFNFPKYERGSRNFGLFNSDILHNIIYFLCFLQKYDNMFIPFQHNIKDKKLDDIHRLTLIKGNDISTTPIFDVITDILGIYSEYFYSFFPYLIIWNNENEYFINDNLGTYCHDILRNNKIRFIVFKLTLVPSTNGTHANIVIYDKKRKVCERFEPFGSTSILNSKKLDEMLKNKLELILGQFEFICPNDYLQEAKFQIFSNDDNLSYKKFGDPLGYCLAWTFFYLELRLTNPDKEASEMVTSAFEQIRKDYSSKTFLIDFIRDYSKKLDDMKNKFMESIGINKKNYYIMDTFDELNNNLPQKITNEINKLINKNIE
jgi:ankyrin repeat protein